MGTNHKVADGSSKPSGPQVHPKAYELKEGESKFTFKHIYTEYSRFHADTSNIIIHCVFVPLILFSMFGLAPYFPKLNPIKIHSDGSFEFGAFDPFTESKDGNVIVSVTHIQWFFASFVYLWCDLLCGVLTSAMGVSVCIASSWVQSQDTVEGSPLFGIAYNFLLIVFIVGWSSQFFGHGVYERRAPALLTNFFFMYIGPFFVVFEELRYLFNYKDEEVSALQNTIEADIAFYRQDRGYPQRDGINVVLNNKKAM